MTGRKRAIRICLSGALGRMGRELARLVGEAQDLELVSALERGDHAELGREIAPGLRVTAGLDEALGPADVLLDFSLPEAVLAHARAAAAASMPVVTGTTGLDEASLRRLRECAERVPVVWSANMSRSVHLLRALVRHAARELGSEDFDAEILEAHHRHKLDAPSGTARELAEAIAAERGGEAVFGRAGLRKRGEVGLASLRGGDLAGEHRVCFLGAGEQIEIVHRATTREHFCRGALDAVRFVAAPGRAPGLYSSEDVFGAVGGRR